MIRRSLLIALLASLLLGGCGPWRIGGATYDEGAPVERFQAADEDVSFDVAMPTDTAGLQLVSVEAGEGDPGSDTVWAAYEDPEDSSRAVEFVQAEMGFLEISDVEDAMPVIVQGEIGRLIHAPGESIRLHWTTTEGYLVEGFNVEEEIVLQIARSITPLDELGQQTPTPAVPRSDHLDAIEQGLRDIQDQVDFPLLRPTTVPRGYTRVFVVHGSPASVPGAMLVVIELRPSEPEDDSVITILQARNMSGPRPDPDETRTITVGDREATIEEAELQNGATLLTLVWEVGDVTYEVSGVDVSEDTLISVAESLRPLDATN